MGYTKIKSLSHDMIPLTETLNLHNLDDIRATKIRNDYITEQLKDNKDYEGWDYLLYYPLGDKPKIKANNILISTNGRVCVERKYGYKVYRGYATSGKYRAKVRLQDRDFEFNIGRAIGSLYLNLPFMEDGRTHKDLIVNVKDPGYPSFINCAWGELGYNAKQPPLEYVIGVIKVKGSWKGYRFALTSKVVSENRISLFKVKQAIKSKKEYRWCRWEKVSATTWFKYRDIKMPEEISSMLKMNSITKGWMESDFKGTLSSDVGGKEDKIILSYEQLARYCISLYGVKRAIKEGTSYLGLNWSIATKKEVKEYNNHISLNMSTHLEELVGNNGTKHLLSTLKPMKVSTGRNFRRSSVYQSKQRAFL